ncbi:MAG: hypothetical protein ABIG87_02500 [Patescibacteria group bacterium]
MEQKKGLNHIIKYNSNKLLFVGAGGTASLFRPREFNPYSLKIIKGYILNCGR